MKKIITGLLIGASALSGFAREGGVSHEWSGAIVNGQHMNTASITSDNTGNLFVGMSLKGTADIDLTSTVLNIPFGGSTSSAIVSYAPDKTLRWSKVFRNSESRITDVNLGINGEVIVTGYFKSTLKVSDAMTFTGSASDWNGYVVKLDKDGKYLSGMTFNAGAECIIRNSEVDAAGNIYITGHTAGNITIDDKGINPITISATKKTGFTVKYDANFNYQWNVVNNGAMDVQNNSMTQNADYIFISGNHTAGTMSVSTKGIAPLTLTATKSGGHVIAIRKSDGDAVHLEKITGTTTTHIGRKIEYSESDKSLVISGEFTGNLTIDNQSITGHDFENSGFISKLKISEGTGDLLVHNWTKTLRHSNVTTSSATDQSKYPITLNDISINPSNGNIYMATTTRRGIFTSLFMNGSGGTNETLIPFTQNTNNDAATVYLDKDSKVINAARFGNTSVSLAQSAHITNAGKLVMGGWFRATTDFDPGTGTVNINGGNSNSVFLAQYSVVPTTHRLYVDDNKNGNGTSWNEAFATITAAFTAAEAGDTILVAEGSYDALTINKDVKLWGGYVGNETDLMMRDAKMNQTIIDGKSTAIHVVNITSPNVVLDGFVIQGGKQSTASNTAGYKDGAGLYYNIQTGNGNLTIKNCDIKDNIGWTEGAGFELRVNGTGTFKLNVENTHIHNNVSRYAPAWLVVAQGSTKVDFNFVNNLVEGNKTVNSSTQWNGFTASAGGMMSGFNTTVLNANIINSTFTKNTADATTTTAGNAVICVSNEKAGTATVNLNVYNSIIFGNEATESIGYWEHGTSYNRMSNLVMRNNITEDTPDATYAVTSATITNNFNTDPKFVDAANGNFMLSATSPAIDAGDVTGIDTMIPMNDLAGKIRTIGSAIDLGAYEYDNLVNTIESAEGTVSVYPNPTSSTLNIEADDLVSVEITNTNGQVVLTATENTINVSDLATGLYILHIQTENGVYSAKVIKK